MDFKDEKKNRQLLIQTQGNLEATVEILSRSIPQHFNFSLQQQTMSDEQKAIQLYKMGFTDENANIDALRRGGGNIDIAITILKEAKDANPQHPKKQFAQNNLFSLPNASTNSTNSSLIDTSSFSAATTVSYNNNTTNPFANVQQPLGLQQQQQQLSTTDILDDPFNLNRMKECMTINNSSKFSFVT
ncbi:hypothetical protein BDF20DRAFT_52867 [Mycotypha africana]|uniref:uncharacterized protein n=1 Tax=Mycotypha africana TaxID=64632 RepID=UPI002300DAD4|nr:uncharacterized protein BDF20DRAFT_52867 [Mycotypha africana]KAI8991609.1 hypothetical protein BDF20DRAFT_52867 [Mycotypha africana]